MKEFQNMENIEFDWKPIGIFGNEKIQVGCDRKAQWESDIKVQKLIRKTSWKNMENDWKPTVSKFENFIVNKVWLSKQISKLDGRLQKLIGNKQT